MVTEALTRPLGPLAVWQWGLVLGGGYLAYRFIRGGSSSGSSSSGGGTVVGGTGDTGSNIIQGPQGEPGPIGPAGPAGPAGAAAGTVKAVTDSFKVKLTKATKVYNPNTGKLWGTVAAGSVVTVVRKKVNGVWEYVIIAGHGAGNYFAPTTAFSKVADPTVTTNATSPAAVATKLTNQLTSIIPVGQPLPAPSTSVENQAVPVSLKSDVMKKPVVAPAPATITNASIKSHSLAV